MRPITNSERRTLRLAGAGIGIYLILFFGLKAWKYGEKRRTEYRSLVTEAAGWSDRLSVYDDKVAATRNLMEQFRLDPATLSRTTLVARASAAIQQAAMRGGIQLGPIRETPSRTTTGKDLSGVQLEGQGQPPAVLRFLQSIQSLGFPLVTDTLQLTPAPMGPGMLKLNLTLVIPDFEKWKPAGGKPDA